MNLTEIGESRVRGYLFVLGRSLRSFLPAEVAEDAVREVESHIRERIEQIEDRESGERRAEAGNPADPAKAGDTRVEQRARSAPRTLGPSDPDDRAVVERVLAELGPPMRVAQAYSREMTLDEAVTTGRLVAIVRALWHLATTSLAGFVWLLLAFTGWAIGVAFLAVAVTKIVLPDNVGIFTVNGEFHGAGAVLALPPGAVAHPFGYWIVPVSFAAGLAILVGTQRASRRLLAWIRSRRPPARLRLRVDVKEP